VLSPLGLAVLDLVLALGGPNWRDSLIIVRDGLALAP
jgi:hypothetical protein